MTATSEYLNQPLRSELEVSTARADAVTDEKILREARFIERTQIECSDDMLFANNGPNLKRWRDLEKPETRPSGAAILRALECKPTTA